MIKVKAHATFGFAGADMIFGAEFEDNTSDEEIEETIRELIMDQVDWSWERKEER